MRSCAINTNRDPMHVGPHILTLDRLKFQTLNRQGPMQLGLKKISIRNPCENVCVEPCCLSICPSPSVSHISGSSLTRRRDGSLVEQWSRNRKVPGSRPSRFALVPFGNPHYRIPRRGLKVVGPLVALILTSIHICFL